MKTKNWIVKSLLIVAAASFMITGCKKKEADDTDSATAADNAYAEATFNDIGNIADEAGQNGNVSNYKAVENTNLLGVCATVTFSFSNKADQDTIVVDFGAGCVCNDGRTRKGQIIVYYSGKFKSPGSTHTITFNNYYVDNNKVDGTKTVTNNGKDGNGNMNWSVSVNGTITLAAGGVITWTSNRTTTLLLGWNTADSTITWAKSKWSVTGNANGTSAKGVDYTATITSPVVRDLTCTNIGRRHFTQGVVDIARTGKKPCTIDFGDGTCDNIAIVTINGKTYKVEMK